MYLGTQGWARGMAEGHTWGRGRGGVGQGDVGGHTGMSHGDTAGDMAQGHSLGWQWWPQQGGDIGVTLLRTWAQFPPPPGDRDAVSLGTPCPWGHPAAPLPVPGHLFEHFSLSLCPLSHPTGVPHPPMSPTLPSPCLPSAVSAGIPLLVLQPLSLCLSLLSLCPLPTGLAFS